MHIPEGFLTGTTTAIGAGVAVAGLAVAIRKADMHADNGRLPLAGLAGAFFLVGDSPFLPIGVGTQGHLLGGTLAVALLGPWLGLITIAVVTVVQALVQGDGGITVLGLNIVNAGIVPAFIGWPLLRGVQAVIRRWQGRSTPGGLALACGVAAYVNVVLASLLFVTEFHLGHKGSVQIGPVIGGTVGTYALIGIAEALLTAGIVKALLARRPDLVLIAPPELRRTLRPPVRRRPAPGPHVPPPPGTEPQRAAATASPPPPPGTEPQRTAGTDGTAAGEPPPDARESGAA
ncbi:energy-coupling factor ABC transporter permease [Patulibacter sp. NPDC049589]|uniref:energy-coupling factor ABC transporter permease n=1 Tax=Patulibacter sp. NPDC049589 TaxID=3154731 RepID=UPI00342D3435